MWDEMSDCEYEHEMQGHHDQQQEERITQDHLLCRYGYDIDDMPQWERNDAGRRIRNLTCNRAGVG